MSFTTTNMRANENHIVAKQSATTMPTSGSIVGNDMGLDDGQLGVVSDSIWGSVALNTFTDATPTVAEAPVIAIYQGNGNSANIAAGTATYPLWVRPYERTAGIDGRGKVYVTKQVFREPSHSTWVVGGAEGDADEINVLDLTDYQLTVAFRGRRVEEMYGREQAAATEANVTTPDFTTLGKTEAEGRSWLVHNLGWVINRSSKAFSLNTRFPGNNPLVAFAINSDGTGTGTEIGGVSPIAEGDVIDVVEPATGDTKTLTLTLAMANSIKNAAIEVFGDVIANVTWKIIPIDLTAEYDGSTDRLLIMGLDDTLAFVDYIPQVKNRLEVGLTYGFDYTTVLNTEPVKADEGQGSGRVLDLLYKATEGQRKYNWRHTMDPVTDFASPYDTSMKYTVYNINHGQVTNPDMLGSVYTPLREIIAIPVYSSGTTPNAYITTFEGYLNSWLGSTTYNTPIVSYN